MLRRSTRNKKQNEKSVSSSDDDEFIEKPVKKKEKIKKNNKKITDTSSSESDIDNYLQPIDKIDLNSSFFDTKKNDSFENIEKEIFSGIQITRLSDSDSSDDDEINKTPQTEPSTSKEEQQEILKCLEEGDNVAKLNFQKLQDYTKKIEEAKQTIENYNAKYGSEDVKSNLDDENKINIEDLLAIGETKKNDEDKMETEETNSDSEVDQEDWEEINTKQEVDESLVPKSNFEITVEMPGAMKKKKGDDLLSAVKRRLNRIRKENQVLIHKVHLLCWIAHGNYINSILNEQNMLALGLSMIPSEKSFPSNRISLDYLEKILKWYQKTVIIYEKNQTSQSFDELLIEQIDKKLAYSKKMLVFIFIIILRSIGVHCRLVLSLQVEPLKPPTSDLHFLGNSSKKEENTASIQEKAVNSTKSKSKSISTSKVIPEKPTSRNKDGASTTSRAKGTSAPKVVSEKSSTSRTKDGGSSTSKAKGTSTPKVVLEKSSPSRNKDAGSSTNSRSKRTSTPKVVLDSKKSSTPRNKDVKEDKSKEKPKPRNSRSKTDKSIEPNTSKTRSKSTTNTLKVVLEKIDEKPTKNRSKSTSKIVQLDGIDDDTEDFKGFEKIENNFNNFENFYSKMYETIISKKIPQLDGATDDSPKSKKPNLKKLKETTSSSINNCKSKRHRKATNYTDRTTSESDECFEESPKKKIKTSSSSPGFSDKEKSKINLNKLKNFKKKEDNDVTDDIMKLIKGRIQERKHLDKMKRVNKRKPVKIEDESEDSDYVPETEKKKYDSESDNEFHPKIKAKPRVQIKKEIKKKITKLKKPKDPNSRKVISSDSEYTEEEIIIKEKKKGNDYWLEVFLEDEEKWVSVDVIFGQIHCDNELHSRATHPVSYVLAWDNQNYLKDISRRYCQNFNTVTRKLRTDKQWWEESIKPFVGPKNARDREEDDELNRQQLEKPLPTTISEYKNHPLYALERHLLKFEVIYPPNAPPLGFVRKEPVYSRECVFVCKSRDIWLKEAKVVKLGEKPYKIVKARPKYDKLSNKMITDQMLEIFGPWQVKDYEPPTAENGIVPRNAFGNVDLFKPSMLPKKCAHLQLPGLNKTARKLNIDCAAAIVGFDFHNGWSHPIYDGFVVCEEFEEQLIAAWSIEQEEIERKEQEKLEARVYGNWKKLIKGLILREKLEVKYGFKQESSNKDDKNDKKLKICTKKRRVMSDTSDEDE